MSTATTTAHRPLEQEAAQMAKGLQVSIAGRRRTIPAASVDRYEKYVKQIEDEQPGDENAHKRRAAIEAVARYLCDDLDPETVGAELAVARERYEATTAAARMIVLLAIEDDASELSLAQRMGINRLTVRKYRGKLDRKWQRP